MIILLVSKKAEVWDSSPWCINIFVAAIAQANVTRTNHVMWTMGDDFQYQYAETWFKQMDKLIHYVNLGLGMVE